MALSVRCIMQRVWSMDAAEAKRFDKAMVDRSRILRERARSQKYHRKDMAVSPGEWDGEVLTFLTKPVGDLERVPEGWFRYNKNYFNYVR